jgi:hypothetical protein
MPVFSRHFGQSSGGKSPGSSAPHWLHLRGVGILSDWAIIWFQQLLKEKPQKVTRSMQLLARKAEAQPKVANK